MQKCAQDQPYTCAAGVYIYPAHMHNLPECSTKITT